MTVELTDVYRYGGKFLGYLVVVAVVGGVFIGAGAYLTQSVGVSLLDLSVESLSSSRVLIGAFLAVVGSVLVLSGSFGLVHKLIADATAVGVGASKAMPVAPGAGVSTDEESTDESADETTDESADETGEETANETVDETGGENIDETGGEIVDETDGRPIDESGRKSIARPVDEEAYPETERPVRDDGTGPGHPSMHEFDGMRSVSADTDEPIDREEPGGDEDSIDGDEPADTVESSDEPPEWTPPDPAEFENVDRRESREQGDEISDDGGVERGTSDFGETTVDSDDEDIEDDRTLADEGRTSFETGGDDDPLGDRLSDDN